MFGIKILGTSGSDSVEVNYIGDIERENQGLEAENEEENEKQNEAEDVTENAAGNEAENEIEERDIIRVLLKNNNYEGIYHESVSIWAPSGVELHYVSVNGEEVEVAYEEVILSAFEYESVQIFPIEDEEKLTITSLERGYGEPEYYGYLEVFSEGSQVVVVNELELEDYLKGVLPSEMPATFESEALKAQAVCARSYAYHHMAEYHYEEYSAHIDDSTSYQVYNNLEEAETCNQAIEETAGQLLFYENQVITAYFFSTSCGYTTNVEAWGGNVSEYEYLQSVEVSDGNSDYEEALPWYQWEIVVSKEVMQDIVESYETIELYGTNESYGTVGEVESVQVTQRGEGGVALVLQIEGTEGIIDIETEYSIREALGSTQYSIALNDGSETSGRELLPSAFFEITYEDGYYMISGGGLGHGIGMSQNGANEMAKKGWSYQEILEFYYQDTIIY